MILSESTVDYIAKSYKTIGTEWAERVPHFTIGDFRNLCPNLFRRMNELEDQMGDPRSSDSGVRFASDRLITVFQQMFERAEAETKKLMASGMGVPDPKPMGLQIYRDDRDLQRGVWFRFDWILLDELSDYLARKISLKEIHGRIASQMRNGKREVSGYMIGGVHIASDGSMVSGEFESVEVASSEPITEERIDWKTSQSEDVVEELELPPLEGEDDAPSLVVIDPAVMIPKSSPSPVVMDDSEDLELELDIEITEAFE